MPLQRTPSEKETPALVPNLHEPIVSADNKSLFAQPGEQTTAAG
jgi:hypothetical protein